MAKDKARAAEKTASKSVMSTDESYDYKKDKPEQRREQGEKRVLVKATANLGYVHEVGKIMNKGTPHYVSRQFVQKWNERAKNNGRELPFEVVDDPHKKDGKIDSGKAGGGDDPVAERKKALEAMGATGENSVEEVYTKLEEEGKVDGSATNKKDRITAILEAEAQNS